MKGKIFPRAPGVYGFYLANGLTQNSDTPSKLAYGMDAMTPLHVHVVEIEAFSQGIRTSHLFRCFDDY